MCNDVPVVVWRVAPMLACVAVGVSMCVTADAW